MARAMQRIALVALLVVSMVTFAACGGKTQETTAPPQAQPSGQQTETSKPEPGTSNEPLEIAVIIKATDSDFWQVVLKGAEKAAQELGDKVKLTTHGPTSEADIDKQVAILEDVISRKPDGIVIASTSSDATVPALERAADQGIKVVLIDNMVNTREDAWISFLATDNIKGGALAAEALVKAIQDAGKPLKGKVGLISSMAGVQVLMDRDQGFIDRMKEIAPEIEILPTRYVDNDIIKALGAAEDLLTANPDLLGFFADNNHTGDGVARAITERGLQDTVAAVAYDSDPEEIEALKSGALDALVVQDPFGMGYKGVYTVVEAFEGKPIEKRVDTGATVITRDNFNDQRSQELLYPEKRK